MLISAVHALLRLHSGALRSLRAAHQVLHGLTWFALSDEEKSLLTQSIYARHGESATELMDWERRWFHWAMPAAPARVLVGGCGAGRELVALAAMGYDVFGAEPVAALCERARRRFGRGRVWQSDYRSWGAPAPRNRILELGRVAALPDRASAWAEPGAAFAAPYDAVLLGWGSLSHVLSSAQRDRVIRACGRWCPRGPILLSFIAASDALRERPVAFRAGAGAGKVLRRLRRLPPQEEGPSLLLPHAGYVAALDRTDIEAMAAATGRRAVIDMDGYPHATLVAP